jgi:hypothetical protein
LVNLAKFTLPDAVNPHARNMRDQQMLDPGIYAAAQDLHALVMDVKDRIRPLVQESGSSSLDASITKMANSTPRFADTASANDVVQGTKQFLGQLKEAAAILSEINRGVA